MVEESRRTSDGALFVLGRMVRDVGFPIVVALILLLKLVPAVDALALKIDHLSTVMEARR